jgi:7-cyano-7-deazaguanine reductase
MSKKSINLTTKNHNPLGKETKYEFTKPDPKILYAIDNPNKDLDYSIKLSCPEFTSICPITSQPDFAHIIIDYVPKSKMIESKSLKIYLHSYRNHGAYHEDCTIKIAKDIISTINPKWLRISGFWYPRGGIPIDVFYEYGDLPKKIFIKENSSYQYIPRS